jgi:excisionase family DNA binding protein
VEKLLTVFELSEHLGISTGTAYHWLSQGRLPCVRFSARCVRFKESDIAKLVDDLGNGSLNSQARRVPGRHRTGITNLSSENKTRRKKENGPVS